MLKTAPPTFSEVLFANVVSEMFTLGFEPPIYKAPPLPVISVIPFSISSALPVAVLLLNELPVIVTEGFTSSSSDVDSALSLI